MAQQRSLVEAPVFSDNSVTPRLLITFARGLNENLNPHISECSAGYNFDLAISQSSLVPRSPYDLIATAPNNGVITGYLQLVKRDNTETTLVVSGDTIYKWDGASTFTAVAMIVTGTSSTTAGLLRDVTWALGDYLIVVDLNLLNPVSKWDGTTWSTLTTGLGSTFYAKYAIVHLNRVWFFNIKLGSQTFPHMILASKFEDPTTLDIALRGGSTDVGGGVFTTGLEAFFLFVPDLKAINGVELFQDTLLISTERGRMWNLYGSSGKDFAFRDFYDTQPAIGHESLKSIGNDVTFVSPGGEINLISAVQSYGNVKNFSISRWIPVTTANLKVINAIVYDEMNQKVLYFIPDKVLVLFKDILAQQDGLSPWSVYTTLDPCGFNTFVARYMLKPGTQDFGVFFGCNEGEVFGLPGTGSGDRNPGPNTTCIPLPPPDPRVVYVAVDETVGVGGSPIACMDSTTKWVWTVQAGFLVATVNLIVVSDIGLRQIQTFAIAQDAPGGMITDGICAVTSINEVWMLCRGFPNNPPPGGRIAHIARFTSGTAAGDGSASVLPTFISWFQVTDGPLDPTQIGYDSVNDKVWIAYNFTTATATTIGIVDPHTLLTVATNATGLSIGGVIQFIFGSPYVAVVGVSGSSSNPDFVVFDAIAYGVLYSLNLTRGLAGKVCDYDSVRKRFVLLPQNGLTYTLIDAATGATSTQVLSLAVGHDTSPPPNSGGLITSFTYYARLDKYIFGQDSSVSQGSTLYIVNPGSFQSQYTYTYETGADNLLINTLFEPFSTDNYVLGFDLTHVKRLYFGTPC